MNATPTVLIVDDNQATAEMTGRLFENHHYRAVCVFSGQAAIQSARSVQPELILLDVMMPGMSGFEVIEHLHNHEETREIPVIFLTAKDDIDDIEQGLNLGADDYIVKPIKPRELLARARSKIEANRLQKALAQKTRDLEALVRVSQELNRHLEIEELLEIVALLALDLTSCDLVVVFETDDTGQITCTRSEQRNHNKLHLPDSPKSILKQVQGVVEPILWSEWPNWTIMEGKDFPDDTTAILVNLIHDDQQHGTMIAFSSHPLPYASIELFTAVSRQTTLALRNAQLYTLKADYAERLEEMVEERTKDLKSAQKLLVRSEKLASVGRLAAGLAHEINNPLTPIQVNLGLIQEDLSEGRPIDPRDVEESLHSVKRISRIVERLQQFTRNRDTDAPSMESLNIARVLDNVIALSRPFYRQGKINIHINVGQDIRIFGNRDQLEQVFVNLMLNAHAAMSEGGQLTIRSEIDQNDASVLIHFQDTGCGIPADKLDVIFEPFYSTKEDGSGLGLFISHQIIQNHSGAFFVDSVVGEGTTFTLRLPLIREAKG